ncbi:hypothetical protein [Pediococcus pentosaceus]|uniref:hypothetical protein n=1 Tax=Pediococcus pentosaceus TaxID=1255 RepID=UPI001E34091D|nr:hypothetical protein [Pediococcus pentosaceus]MCM6820387.1 hypothetical protein [Pediococcus pentosaceus]
MIINDKKMDQYLEVQLIGHKDSKIKAKTSAGQYIFVYPTTEQTNDPLFWKSLKILLIIKCGFQLLNNSSIDS